MTQEQEAACDRVRQMLRDKLSVISRELHESVSADYHTFLALSPRITVGDSLPFDHADNLALQARSDAGAFDAAKLVAAVLLERDGRLPENLARFAAEVLRGEADRPDHGKGKRRLTDLRNKILALAVWKLEGVGIKPTKSVGSEKKDGCDIVAEMFDDLLAKGEVDENIIPKGGEFEKSTMHEIWLKNPEIKSWREWQSCLPRELTGL